MTFTEIARFYGDGANYKSVWNRFQTFILHSKAQTQAVNAGTDPYKVQFLDGTGGKAAKGKLKRASVALSISKHLHTHIPVILSSPVFTRMFTVFFTDPSY
jgi:hypothetical protein